jgi:hypothetical protein
MGRELIDAGTPLGQAIPLFATAHSGSASHSRAMIRTGTFHLTGDLCAETALHCDDRGHAARHGRGSRPASSAPGG